MTSVDDLIADMMGLSTDKQDASNAFDMDDIYAALVCQVKTKTKSEKPDNRMKLRNRVFKVKANPKILNQLAKINETDTKQRYTEYKNLILAHSVVSTMNSLQEMWTTTFIHENIIKLCKFLKIDINSIFYKEYDTNIFGNGDFDKTYIYTLFNTAYKLDTEGNRKATDQGNVKIFKMFYNTHLKNIKEILIYAQNPWRLQRKLDRLDAEAAAEAEAKAAAAAAAEEAGFMDIENIIAPSEYELADMEEGPCDMAADSVCGPDSCQQAGGATWVSTGKKKKIDGKERVIYMYNNNYAYKLMDKDTKQYKYIIVAKTPSPKPKKDSSPKCVELKTKLYTERKSPPYPANACQGQVRKGNDDLPYMSVANKNGVFTWKKVKEEAAPKKVVPKKVKEPAPKKVKEPAPKKVKEPAPKKVKEPAPKKVKEQAPKKVKEVAPKKVKEVDGSAESESEYEQFLLLRNLERKFQEKLAPKKVKEPAPKKVKEDAPKKEKKEVACVEQTSKKYTDRAAPPYPANACQGQTLMGNDHKMYASVANKNGVFVWKKM